jgi:predicted molibdopterin-dependent oxidoreductase YjgC
MFKRIEEVREDDGETVTLTIDGAETTVPAGISVAAALLLAGPEPYRRTAVGDVPRAPYCMMGVCFDCLVEIDGASNRQGCLVTVADGMSVRRALGKRGLGE